MANGPRRSLPCSAPRRSCACPTPPRDRVLLQVAYGCGLRYNGLLHLRVTDIDRVFCPGRWDTARQRCRMTRVRASGMEAGCPRVTSFCRPQTPRHSMRTTAAFRHHLLSAVAAALVLSVARAEPADKGPDRGPAAFKHLSYRSLGPAAGGRVCRVCGVSGNPWSTTPPPRRAASGSPPTAG